MNATQIHLALTHLPVILSLVGMTALAISFIRNNISLRRTAFYILVIAGLSSLPVFFTGEGAEEVVEGLPGVTESSIEAHESTAKLAFFAILAAGVLALVALLKYFSPNFHRTMAVVVLLVSLGSTGLMVKAAHLGGKIRHTELMASAASQQQEQENSNKTEENEKNEDD